MTQILEFTKPVQNEAVEWNQEAVSYVGFAEVPAELSAFVEGVQLCRSGIEAICAASSRVVSG